jgi:hypothetical protein
MALHWIDIGSAVQCPNNFCSGFAPIANGLFAFLQFNGGTGQYDVLSEPIADASLPENVAYGLFLTFAASQGLSANRAYTVKGWYKGLELNIQVPADVGVMEVPTDWTLDPATWTHEGDTSYFDLWRLFDAGHYVFDPIGGVQYHEDIFGALLPFHYADWLIGKITGPGPTMSFTCQVGQGCQ